MMKKLSKVFALATVVVLSLQQTEVRAATATMSLTVSGTIAARPQWQNSSSSEISTLNFAFSGYAGATAGVDVDSSAASAKLVNAPSYPASVALTLPSSCSIGSTNVTNSHVKLYTDASGSAQEETGATISISSNTTKSFTLRFASAGNYGDDSGAVACSSNGSLTFTY